MRKTCFIFAVIIFCLSNIAQANNGSKIVGKWLAYAKSGGTFTEGNKIEEIPEKYQYIWEFTKDGKILAGEYKYKYKLSGNKLLVNKWGMEAEHDITELTDKTLIIKKEIGTVYYRKIK